MLADWLRLQGESAGWYSLRFAGALFAAMNVITFVVLIRLSHRRLDRLDAGRRKAHDALIRDAKDLRLANERLLQEVAEHRLTERTRRLTQQHLHQARKIESLGTLAGGIAHDFNNILTAVSLNAERARTHLPQSHPAYRNLEEISQAGTHAATLVRRIMAFGRQEKPRLRTVDLRHTVDESLRFLRLSLPPHIRLKTTLAPDTPPVSADTTQIRQVILNLASNAVQAMEVRGGTLSFSLEKVCVTAALSRRLGDLPIGTYARLAVSDTGVGMQASVLDRIFDPFFTTKSPGRGAGLGLSVVHGIVALHKGFITAYSEPERGTTLHAYFPAETPPEDQKAEARAASAHGTGHRFEDNP